MTDFGQGRIGAAIARASLDPNAWQGVTDAILAAFPGTKTGIVGHDSTVSRSIPAAHSGYDPSYGPSYEAHYGRIVPKLDRWLGLPLGRVAHVWDIMTEEELLRSEYYNDWLRPQEDARQAAIAVLQRDPGRMFLITTQVERRVADKVMSPVMQAMRSLYPLMRHALEINRMMMGLRLDSALLRLGMEPDGAAVVLLGPRAGILFANARAEALLAEGRVIHADPFGRLRFADGHAAIRLASALDPRVGGRGVSFQITGPGRSQDVRLMRLEPEAVERIEVPMLTGSPKPMLLLVLRPASGAVDEARRIAERLKLTRAEAEVALSIAGGATLAEVAASRGVSIHTVREQVKAALGKTGSRRQADLVRAVEAARRSR